MPQLHERLSLDEAVAEFGGAGDAEFCCDRQFVILPEVVVCAFTIDGTELASPSAVVWKPGRLNYEPDDQFPWLPRRVRGEENPSKRKAHHMLLRLPSDERFLYAGEAHLGSYGDAPGGPAATFFLGSKLPRNEWLALGGYAGWLIEANHRKHYLNEGDVQGFDSALSEVRIGEFSHLLMTRYEEDSLTVHTNASRGWLMYLRTPDDGGLYADSEVADSSARELFRCGCGVSLDFETRNTVARDVALAAAREFFVSGQLPQSVRWMEQ